MMDFMEEDVKFTL